MKAQLIKKFGDPTVFELAEISKPDLKKNHGRETHGKILSEIAKIVDSGQLKPMIDPHKVTLETISEAHALLESGKAQGKVVLSIS